MIETILWMLVGALGTIGLLAIYTAWVVVRQEDARLNRRREK
jgi:hypothetical protein